ncbi:MAG: glycosyltransferase family 9 protein [Georgfuchsia sp.]
MKIDTMRRVDRLAGIPLCLLLTLLLRCKEIFSKPNPQPPHNVLFIELSEMGSAILVDPAMRKMQRERNAQLHFLIFNSNAASLRLLNTVPQENVFAIRENSFLSLVLDSIRFIFWARQRRIDTVIDLELFSRYSALLTGASGARNRIGFHAFENEGLYRGAMLTHRVAYNPHLHIAKNFIALVNAALASKVEIPFSKTLIEDSEVKLSRAVIDESKLAALHGRIGDIYPAYDEQRHRVVLINPNASDLLPQRRWMPEHFVAVMKSLLAENDDVLILITGATAERGGAEALLRQVQHERCLNFAGCNSLDELPALYQLAELMLTNDSGPGHFSSVTDLRTFVIFGPETPLLYGSLGNSTPIYAGLACSPCVSAANHRKTPCTDNVCLQVITPEKVLDHLRPYLAERRHRA